MWCFPPPQAVRPKRPGRNWFAGRAGGRGHWRAAAGGRVQFGCCRQRGSAGAPRRTRPSRSQAARLALRADTRGGVMPCRASGLSGIAAQCCLPCTAHACRCPGYHLALKIGTGNLPQSEGALSSFCVRTRGDARDRWAETAQRGARTALPYVNFLPTSHRRKKNLNAKLQISKVRCARRQARCSQQR